VIIPDKGGKPRRAQDLAAPGGGASTTSFTNANLGPSLATHAASRPAALDEDAKNSYDAALGLVNAKHYTEALDALAGFLVRWPDHPNADNAMYWRGECYFAQGDYADAAKEFEGLLARFPMGNKAPDALLKLGISEQRLDDAPLARRRFDRLRREFPHSDAAKHIPEGAQTVRSAPGDKP
jgi:tol-pal system protein YbgF